jgi:hypothetical protein
MVKVALIVSVIFLFPSLLLAKREHPEKWYQERWCREKGGQAGFRSQRQKGIAQRAWGMAQKDWHL